MLHKIVLTLCMLVMLGSAAQAQLFRKASDGRRRTDFEPYSSAGIGVGTANYYGELSPIRDPVHSTFGMMRWNVSANYTRQFSPRWAGRVSLTMARISGDSYRFINRIDTYGDIFMKNLHFRNDLKELSAVGIYNFGTQGRNFLQRARLTPYIFGGVAVFAHNPKAKPPVAGEVASGGWVALQPLGTEGQGRAGYARPYSLVNLAIPFGLGFRYKFNEKIDVSLEAGFRYTFTDYIDDIGSTYADPAALADNPLAAAMANRSLESIAARRGGDRTEAARRYLVKFRGYPDNGTFDPFAAPVEGFSTGDIRGGGNTDLILLTTLRVNYILSPAIRCPKIK